MVWRPEADLFWRPADSIEIAILEKIVSLRDFEGRARLLRQIQGAEVKWDEAERPEFMDIRIADSVEAMTQEDQLRLCGPIEAYADDADGELLLLNLHIRHGRLSELEIVRFQEGEIKRYPTAEVIRADKWPS